MKTFRDYLVEAAVARERTKQSWQARLAHWERPASDHEESKIEHAAAMVRRVVAGNEWLTDQEAIVIPQGSYYNNTNVRLEADMDLRIQLPFVRIEYDNSVVNTTEAFAALAYVPFASTLQAVAARTRLELVKDLCRTFGVANVDHSGTKAIRVDQLDGSRSDCDVVPAFHLDYVTQSNGGFFSTRGVGILGTDGNWTMNFPTQHHDNGIAKRERTSHRFKKTVRMLKWLNYELADDLKVMPKRLPSFLIECLVYSVQDELFIADRYDRLRGIVRQLQANCADPAWINKATEINEVKFLFHPSQPWTVEIVQKFCDAALKRLEG